MNSFSRSILKICCVFSLAFGIFVLPGAVGVSHAAKQGKQIVDFGHDYPIGSIIVVNSERRLYYVLGNGQALKYPIAIGTPRNQWTGESFVQNKRKNPSWTPPWNRSRTVPGGPGNPLGVRAIYLDWGLYRIHGTNAPGSIGRAASHGCIRMHNKDVIDLYERVHIGAPVYVLRKIGKTDKFARQ